MATHFSILVWEIPGTEEPSRLQSMGLQKDLDMTLQLNNNSEEPHTSFRDVNSNREWRRDLCETT